MALSEDLIHLLVEGNFEECFNTCRDHISAFTYTFMMSTPSKPPKIEFGKETKLSLKFKVAIIYIQAFYEQRRSEELDEQGLSKWESDFTEFERFLAQNSPVPFVVALTWLQLKTLLYPEKVKTIFPPYLKQIAETLAHEDTSLEDTLRLKEEYGVMARLYAINCLLPIGELDLVRKFHSFLKKSSTLVNEEIKREIYLALTAYDKPIQKELVSNQSLEEDISAENSNLLPEEANGEVKAEENGQKKIEVVLSLEQLGGISVLCVTCLFLISKKKRIAELVGRGITFVGDKVFGE